jgi:membrane protease YdiL (CAAX protease family)
VALAYHLPDHASERAALFDGGEVLLVIAAVFFAGAGLAGLAGLVLLVLGAVWAAHGQLRPAFQPPAPGGSVYIETFLIFLVGFVALSAAGEALPDSVKSRAGPALLLSHWLLALVPLWAVLRGTAWREAMFQMGLHRGRGLLRELSAGVGVYVAGLPLVFASVVAALGLVMLMNALMGTPDATPRNPLIDRLARGDPVYLAALFFMATVWAPLVEETIFRGCLYRHLSARWPFAAAGAVSAAAFGVVHGVPLPLTLPLMTLGFIFAFMRHWRGSLAAPIAAHALHNATVLTFALTMLSVLKD